MQTAEILAVVVGIIVGALSLRAAPGPLGSLLIFALAIAAVLITPVIGLAHTVQPLYWLIVATFGTRILGRLILIWRSINNHKDR